MQRLLVVLLAAFDALVVVACGVAVALAPLTLLWVFGIGSPDWGALWPAAATVWQLGHLVPVALTLPGDYLAQTGIPVDAASFVISLAPLAFAVGTAWFAARSGARAARAGAWVTGVSTGVLTVAAASTGIALTQPNPIAGVELWQAVVLPTAVFAAPALLGAVTATWREGDDGVIDALRRRVDAWPAPWTGVPAAIARGVAVAVSGLVGVAALAVAVAVAIGGGRMISLYETGNLDLLGASVVTLGQLAYLPVLVVWALAFIAGPGFALGVGTVVSPAGTQVAAVPAVPVLGIVPESVSPWLLALALAPVAVGGLAGWAAKVHLVPRAPRPPSARTLRRRQRRTLVETPVARATLPSGPRASAVAALLATDPAHRTGPEPATDPDPAPVAEPDADTGGSADATPATPSVSSPPAAEPPQPYGALAVVAVGIAVLTAAVAALLATVSSGSIGPGSLAQTGPDAGALAVAVGLETLVGAAIVTLTTRRSRSDGDGRADRPVPVGDDVRAWPPLGLAPAPEAIAVPWRPTDDDAASRVEPEFEPEFEPWPGPGHQPEPEPPREQVDDPAPDAVTSPIDIPDPFVRPDPADLPDPSTLPPNRPRPLPPLD